MSIKKNIERLLMSDISNYKISQETGIAQTTLGDYTTGKSKIGNMKLDHAIKLNEYYLENEGEIKMEKALDAIKNINLGWSSEGVKVLGGVEDVAEGYVDVMDHVELDMTPEQYVLEELKNEDRVKEFDFYENEQEAYEDRYVWVEELNVWMDLN